MTFKKLGVKTPLPKKPTKETLDTFDAPAYVKVVTFETDEFTSLCPVTGQPDWCHIKIEYLPLERCVESKSLKLYLQSYRNYPAFIETLSAKICDDLYEEISPDFIEVTVKSTSRGGITVEASAARGSE